MGQITPDATLASAIIVLLSSLASDSLYWIATILRGPDSQGGGSTVKTETACRVRGFLYGKLTEQGLKVPTGTARYTPLSAAEMKERDEFLLQNGGRYMRHYNAACQVILSAFGYDLKTETDMTKPKEPTVDTTRADALKNILQQVMADTKFYTIIASLRSADTAQGSKDYTTARIRGFLETKTGITFNVLTAQMPLTVEQMVVRDELLAKESSHFQSYYKETVKELGKIYGYDLMTEQVIN
jgi:hypothetical protein